MSWTQAVCPQCWKVDNPNRSPVRFVVPMEERCCKCGVYTEWPIYIRIDPRSVPFPSPEPKGEES